MISFSEFLPDPVPSMRYIDLNSDALKILGTHFSYNKKFREEKKFFKSLTSIENMENEKPYTRRENRYF